MPAITEAHVVLIKNHKPGYTDIRPEEMEADINTPWEDFLQKDRKTAPNRYQVHLVVSGFAAREDARGFAENFMAHGHIFLFNSQKRPLYRLEVQSDQKGEF